MIYQVICVRDRVADAWVPPTFQGSVGGAVRAFSDAVNNSNSQDALSHHPADFELYLLGSFDDATGRFEVLEERRMLCRGEEVVKAK